MFNHAKYVGFGRNNYEDHTSIPEFHIVFPQHVTHKDVEKMVVIQFPHMKAITAGFVVVSNTGNGWKARVSGTSSSLKLGPGPFDVDKLNELLIDD